MVFLNVDEIFQYMSGLCVDKTIISEYNVVNKTFRHVETLFVQGYQVRTDQNKLIFVLPKKNVCFDQYELDYLGRIKFLHVEMPYTFRLT